MYDFKKFESNALNTATSIERWIADYFKSNGKVSPCLVGISGGKNSTVTAALCVKALGATKVLGIMMPNGNDPDLKFSKQVCQTLGIKSMEYNIAPIIKAQQDAFDKTPFLDFRKPTSVIRCNNPARIRMLTLYYIANQLNGRVANTTNFSERYLGYTTSWGDQCGDFAPLADFTTTEVYLIGKAMGLPLPFLDKIPNDGMCGQPDEERLDFTYTTLDNYLRGNPIDKTTQDRIEIWHSRGLYKTSRISIPKYTYTPSGTLSI